MSSYEYQMVIKATHLWGAIPSYSLTRTISRLRHQSRLSSSVAVG